MSSLSGWTFSRFFESPYIDAPKGKLGFFERF